MSSDDPVAGWYPDPLGEAELRYWDGSTWTPQVAGSEAPEPHGDLHGRVGARGPHTPQRQRVEYDVQTVRVTIVGDKVNDKAVNSLLNKRAREGWSVTSMNRIDVKGGVGPRGVDGLLIVFERPVDDGQ